MKTVKATNKNFFFCLGGGGGKGGKIERNCGAPSVRGIIRTTDSKRSSDYKLSTVAGGQFTLSAQLID